MSKPFTITTAISYPNGRPHIGHAYEVIATAGNRTLVASAPGFALSAATANCLWHPRRGSL